MVMQQSAHPVSFHIILYNLLVIVAKILWFTKLPLENDLDAERMLKTMAQSRVSQAPPSTTDNNNVDGTKMAREEVNEEAA